MRWDFPGGTVVKNPPANLGGTGSIPGPGRSHIPWVPKVVYHSYWAPSSRAHARQQEKPLQWEAHKLQRRIAPHLLRLEKAWVQQQRPRAAKNK